MLWNFQWTQKKTKGAFHRFVVFLPQLCFFCFCCCWSLQSPLSYNFAATATASHNLQFSSLSINIFHYFQSFRRLTCAFSNLVWWSKLSSRIFIEKNNNIFIIAQNWVTFILNRNFTDLGFSLWVRSCVRPLFAVYIFCALLSVQLIYKYFCVFFSIFKFFV